MLQELGREIMTLLEEKEVKDAQIAELRKENEELRVTEEQANLKLDEVKAVVAELNGLIANA